MSQAIDLIVGLGNPGDKYRLTRHNIGFWVVDRYLETCGERLKFENKFHGDLGKVQVAGHPVWFLKPQTFMNHSGEAVAAVCQFYKLDIRQCLVIHDELDIAPGTIRLKRGGGHGGHNGLRDIMQLAGKDFMRLRMGIGHPGHKSMVTPYVLGPPAPEERTLLADAVDEAADTLPMLVEGEWDKAMTRLHSRTVE